MIYDQNDVDLMALCAVREAEGEGLYGCFLVMQVIYNRVGKPGFGHTIHDVITGKNQFSSMSIPSDPRYSYHPSETNPILMGCRADAPNILVGTNDDPTHGAVYYANEATATSGWYFDNIINSGNHLVTLKYGRHTFRG